MCVREKVRELMAGSRQEGGGRWALSMTKQRPPPPPQAAPQPLPLLLISKLGKQLDPLNPRNPNTGDAPQVRILQFPPSPGGCQYQAETEQWGGGGGELEILSREGNEPF